MQIGEAWHHPITRCAVAVMTYSTIQLETHDAVARLILNRPERLNALNQTMLDEIRDALDRAETDNAIRVLIVTGAGTAFSSGFDLKEQMERRPTGIDTWRGILRKDFDTVMRFWHLSKPTIAAVNGHCLAGACELAMACDLTIAADTAVFGEPELKFGAGIVVMILPWLVGPKVAKEIILTGADRIPANEALRIGMVNRVVPAADLGATSLRLARHIAAIDPDLVKQTKRAINRTLETMGMGEALEEALAIDLEIEGRGSPDKIRFMEIARTQGLRAALAWRDARFPGAEGT
jgi:enoyl-CoA hydratase